MKQDADYCQSYVLLLYDTHKAIESNSEESIVSQTALYHSSVDKEKFTS